MAAFGAALSLPFAASAAAAPAVCACGGGGGSASPDPVPDTPEPAVEPPVAETPPPSAPAPAPPPESLPRSADAAEAWTSEPEPEPEPAPAPEPEPAVEAEPAPEPEPAPERTVYGVNAETYRRLGSEDQQAIRDGYQAEPEPAAPAESLPQSADAAEAWTSEPEPQQEPAPEPAPSLPTTPDAAEAWTQDEPADEAEPPQPQIYGVDADLYRRLGPEDQQALRDEHEPAPAPAPSLPTTQDEPADEAEPPQPQMYGVNADLYRRLGLEDQQAIRDEYEQRQSLPTTPDAAERWLEDEAAVVPPAHTPTPPPDEPEGDGDGPLVLPPWFSSIPYTVQQAMLDGYQAEEDAAQAEELRRARELAARLPDEDAELVLDAAMPNYVSAGRLVLGRHGHPPRGRPGMRAQPVRLWPAGIR